MIYLTGVSNTGSMQLADRYYGRVGVLLGPLTAGGSGAKVDYRHHIPSYSCWAADNGCFANAGGFDEASWLAMLEGIVEHVDGAHECCRFAVAPDVFDPVAKRGDSRATVERSRPVLPKIRERGCPAALVLQDGAEQLVDELPWDEFDVAFIGGSDAFKLGYPTKVSRGNPHYLQGSAGGAESSQSRAWARLMAKCHTEGKAIHVGRVNSQIRMLFALSIGAESADGTFLAFSGGSDGLRQVSAWLDSTREAAA